MTRNVNIEVYKYEQQPNNEFIMSNNKIEVSSEIIGVKRAELIATVTRADGSVEHLGVIAAQDFTKKSILKRLGDLLCRLF